MAEYFPLSARRWEEEQNAFILIGAGTTETTGCRRRIPGRRCSRSAIVWQNIATPWQSFAKAWQSTYMPQEGKGERTPQFPENGMTSSATGKAFSYTGHAAGEAPQKVSARLSRRPVRPFLPFSFVIYRSFFVLLSERPCRQG